MPEYLIAAATGLVLVVLAELLVFRTGILRDRAYWIAMAICLFFMVLTNGWLTKLSAPIVIYEAVMKSPYRFPWDIPVEDYLFGFALLTLAVVLWEWDGRRRPDARPRQKAFEAVPESGSAEASSDHGSTAARR